MLELEVKILNMDLNILEDRIKSIGGRFVSEENQINTIFDNKDMQIEDYLKSYLRIRETQVDGKEDIRMTLKKSIKSTSVRENIEYDVKLKDKTDKENMIKIFALLGYDISNIGYKNRRSYVFENIRFDLDTWDKETYPNPYMEIEVEKSQDLDRILDMLQIPRENVSTKSITELKKEIK